MKVWITKYALTQGITEFDNATLHHDIGGGDMISIPGNGRDTFMQHFHGDDWHQTREHAVARAEKMRDAKITTMEFSLSKLRKLSFAD
jgi:hypothetical protein